MDTHLPKEVQDGLDTARKAAIRRSGRLRIKAGDASFAVLRSWDNGFAVDAASAPNLRGRVGLYDGARLISCCLIIASEEEGGEIRFEYKRMTEASGEQPLDFYRPPTAPSTAPVALLEAACDH